MIIKQFEKAPVIFHYNKKHNEDQSVPPWVLKVKGHSFYVNHFDIMPNVGFSTKETPDNPHTKGSLKIVGRLTITEEDGNIIGTIE